MKLEEYLLVCLSEECSEVIQICSKSLRFGLDEVHIDHPDGPNNKKRLINELNDIIGICHLLADEHVLPTYWENLEKQVDKKNKFRKFLEHSKKEGILIYPTRPLCDHEFKETGFKLKVTDETLVFCPRCKRFFKEHDKTPVTYFG